MYEEGLGVEPDIKEVLKWYELEAEFGIEDVKEKIRLLKGRLK